MLRTIATALLCSVILLAQTRGQEVLVPRQPRAVPVPQSEKMDPSEVLPEKAESAQAPAKKLQSAKAEADKAPVVKGSLASPPLERVHSVKTDLLKMPTVKPLPDKVQSVKVEPAKAPVVRKLAAPPSENTAPVKTPMVKESPATSRSEKVQSAKAEPVKVPAEKESPAASRLKKVQSAKVEPVKVPAEKESPATLRWEKVQSAKAESVRSSATKKPLVDPVEKSESAKLASAKVSATREQAADMQLVSSPVETASTRLADGFDFPVGKPEAEGYYKARGFRPGGHVGEDWDGVRGGDTDFKDPIYCIGDGVVVFARDVRRGWGNVVIVRHGYREKGGVQYIDSLYGHLNSILVKRGQKVARGQQVGTMGTAHGQYDAHLHLEIRKNIEIGMSRAKFQKTFSNYYDPSQFIASHRRIAGGGTNFRVAMNTFTHDSAFHFDDAPKFSARKRSTSESSAALRRALSGTDR